MFYYTDELFVTVGTKSPQREHSYLFLFTFRELNNREIRTLKESYRMDKIIRRLKIFVGCNRRNLLKLATKIKSDENINQRKL